MSNPYLLIVIFSAVVLVIIVFILVLKRKKSGSSLSIRRSGQYSSGPRASPKGPSVVQEVPPPQSTPRLQQSKSVSSKTMESGQASPSPADESYVVVQLRQNLKLKALGNERVVD